MIVSKFNSHYNFFYPAKLVDTIISNKKVMFYFEEGL